MTFEELFMLCKRGVISRKTVLPPVKWAFENGLYLGCPGKDIYQYIKDHNYELINDGKKYRRLVKLICSIVPKKPTKKIVQFSACFRYIYGAFGKQGIHNPGNLDHLHNGGISKWELSKNIMDSVYELFVEKENFFGQMLCLEMSAHRIADESYILGDIDSAKEAIRRYSLSHKLSCDHGFNKNRQSSLFWMCMFCEKFLKHNKDDFVYSTLVDSAKKFIIVVDNHVYDKSIGSWKLNRIFDIIHDILGEDYKKYIISIKHVFENPIFKKAIYDKDNNPYLILKC